MKKLLFAFLILLTLAIPTVALASSTATTTVTGTVPPIVEVSTSGQPYDLTVNILSNCDMTVTITRVGDNIIIEKQIK